MLNAFDTAIRDHINRFGDEVFRDAHQRERFLDIMALQSI